MSESVTLVCTFSRRWCVPWFFDALDKMDLGGRKWHLLVIDNTKDTRLYEDLAQEINRCKGRYASHRLIKTGRTGRGETALKIPGTWEESKLPNIWGLQKDIVRLVKTEMFVQLEDDTLAPFGRQPKAALRLLDALEKNERVAMVTGVEPSRSDDVTVKVRMGVHLMVMEENKIVSRISLPGNLRGLRQVEACGWYFFAARMKPWRKAIKTVDKYAKTLPRWGLDNAHTYEMRRAGNVVLADFGVSCAHMNISPGRVLMWTKSDAVAMVDREAPGWCGYYEGKVLHTEEQLKIVRGLVRRRCPIWKP